MLIYDGDCGFCTVTARWAERRLPAGTPVVSWQEIEDLSALGLTAEDVTNAAYWIDPGGGVRRGERAISGCLQAMGGPWSGLGRVMDIPPMTWLAGPTYRLVARYRHRLPGGTKGCRLPRQ